MKVACTVWSGGKGSDYFKALPITIDRVSFSDEYSAVVTFEDGQFWAGDMELTDRFEVIGHVDD